MSETAKIATMTHDGAAYTTSLGAAFCADSLEWSDANRALGPSAAGVG